MKVKKITVENIGLLENAEIEVNKPLILFYGSVCQGKTTVLNSVKWCFGGSFPDDIIQHGKKEASVTIVFENGSITREWYVGKDKKTHSRAITFIRDGKPVKKPVDEIKKFLNPFLLDQDHLRKMTELERKRFFVELFGVDTSHLDSELTKCEQEAKMLRATIRVYGEIDLKPVELIDTEPLFEALKRIQNKHRETTVIINSQNGETRERNSQIIFKSQELQKSEARIVQIENELAKERRNEKGLTDWIASNPPQEETPLPEPPDTSDIDAKINEASAVEVRYEQYQNNLTQAKERDEENNALHLKTVRIADIRKEKTKMLASISESCNVKGLSFDGEGSFLYEGTTAGMLSGSQIMRLSEEISGLYPKGLGISLIDRAESLGKSVFLFVDKAKEEEKTILATIVGEKPANVPEDIGVFIVNGGEVKQ